MLFPANHSIERGDRGPSMGEVIMLEDVDMNCVPSVMGEGILRAESGDSKERHGFPGPSDPSSGSTSSKMEVTSVP